MSARDDLAAKLAKTSNKQREEQKSVDTESVDTESGRGDRGSARTPRVRITVDLPAARHDSLKTWCQETAREQGRVRITAQELVNTLVHRLLTDETLARKIRDDLKR